MNGDKRKFYKSPDLRVKKKNILVNSKSLDRKNYLGMLSDNYETGFLYPLIENTKGPKKIFQTELEHCYSTKEDDTPYVIKDHRVLKSLDKIKVYSQIEKVCKHFYNKLPESEDNIRDLISKKLNVSIQKLNKKYLTTEVEDKPKKVIKISSLKKLGNLDNISNYSKEIEILNNYYNDTYMKGININNLSRYRYEHFANKKIRIQHPLFYRLKNELSSSLKLPPILTNNNPIELSSQIPEKKFLSKEEKKKAYNFYREVKEGKIPDFHI